MINALLNTLLKVIFFILQLIMNVVLLPLTLLIQTLFPNVSNYFSYFETLFNDYLINGIRFMREVFYNITGVDRNLMGILFMIPLTYLTFSIMNASVRFMVSVYRIYKTGKDS